MFESLTSPALIVLGGFINANVRRFFSLLYMCISEVITHRELF